MHVKYGRTDPNHMYESGFASKKNIYLLFIALCYKQLSAHIKMKNYKVKPVLLAPLTKLV